VSSDITPRVLITGKNGQVGRELTERAAELAIDFVAFDSKELDIRDRVAVLAAVAKYQPTAVINAAAYTAVDKAEEEKELAYAVNRDGVENLALACKTQDIPLIHISTDYVFDGEKDSPYVESDTPNPIGVYGASKYAGEEVLRATWHKHVIVRVSWVFGRYGNNFVKTMLRLAKERDELGVVDDQFGAPTSSIDIARVLLSLVIEDKKDFGLYHLESNPKVSWHGFAQKIFEEAKMLGLIEKIPVVNPISSEQFPTPVKRPVNSKLRAGNGLSSVTWPEALSQMLSDLSVARRSDK
jgi:dTDP-4-dehydrorhamnose reductase